MIKVKKISQKKKSRKYPQKYMEKLADWRKRNPEKMRAYGRRDYARLIRKLLGGKTKEEFIESRGSKCFKCASNKDLRIKTKDFKGVFFNRSVGKLKVKDIVVVCRGCILEENKKNRRDFGEWTEEDKVCRTCHKNDSKRASKGQCVRCYERTRQEYKKKYYLNKIKDKKKS